MRVRLERGMICVQIVYGLIFLVASTGLFCWFLLDDYRFGNFDWSTPMDDAKHSSTIYYILKRIDDFGNIRSWERKRYRVLYIFFNDSKTALKYDKKLGFQTRKKRKYVAETKMIHIPIAEGEFFSDQEMNDYINERKKNDR